MNKKKNIYEFQHVTYDKLFIKIRGKTCEISHVNTSHGIDEDSSPFEPGYNALYIPMWLLPKLKEGIEKALAEGKKEDLDEVFGDEEDNPF